MAQAEACKRHDWIGHGIAIATLLLTLGGGELWFAYQVEQSLGDQGRVVAVLQAAAGALQRRVDAIEERERFEQIAINGRLDAVSTQLTAISTDLALLRKDLHR
jgi:hypothetical protein